MAVLDVFHLYNLMTSNELDQTMRMNWARTQADDHRKVYKKVPGTRELLYTATIS
jgi:hypothetical protein